MRKSGYLTSALLAGLFITSALLSPAMGQERSLQPQGAWAITKVDRTSQGGNSYCTLSRIYNDGIVLSLGRNQTEEYSLAIDFQKDVFDPDKPMKISLQPGPGQIRSYDMMPTSPKAIVIRLGWDTGFFDAINKSQEIKAKLADKGYSFSIPEIAKGQGELASCMDGLKTAKNSADNVQTKDVLNAAAGSIDKNFGAEKSSIKTASLTPEERADIAQGKADKNFGQKTSKTNMNDSKVAFIAPAAGDSKSDQNEKSVNVPRPPDSDSALLEQQTQKLKAERLALQQKMDKLELENSKMEAASAASVLAASDKANLIAKELEKKLAAANAEKDAAKKQAELALAAQKDFASAAAGREALAAQLAKTEEEKHKSLKIANAAKEAMTTSYKKTADDINSLQQKINALTSENEALKKGATSTSAELQKQLASSLSEKQALEARLAALSQENDVNEKAAAAAAIGVDTLRREQGGVADKAKALEQQVAALSTENEALKKSNSAKDVPSEKTTAFKKQIDALANENAALKASIATKNTIAQTSELSAAATAALQKQIADLTSENTSLKQAAVKGASGEKSENVLTLERQNKILTDRVAALEKSAPVTTSTAITKLQAKLQEAEIRNAQLEDTLRQSQVRIGETAINIENKSIKKIMDLEAKLDAAQKDNLSLSKKIEDANAQRDSTQIASVAGNPLLENTTKRYNEASLEIQRLGQAIEQEKASCNAQKAEIENMLFDPAVTDRKQQERLAQLQSQLETANAAIKDKQKMVQYAIDQGIAEKAKAMEAEKATLTAQIAALKAGGTAKTGAATSLAQADTASALKKQAAEYQSLVATYKTDNDKLTSGNAALKAEAEKLRVQIAELQSAQKTVEAETSKPDPALVKQATDLRSEVERYKADNDKLANGTSALKAEAEKLRQQVAALQSAQKTAEAEASKPDPALVKQATELRSEVERYKADNDKLTNGTSALKAEAEKLRQQVATLQSAQKMAEAEASKPDPVLTKRASDLQSAIETYKADKDRLEKNNAALKAESDMLREQVFLAQQNQNNEQTAQMEAATRALNVANAELSQRKVREEAYRKQIAMLEANSNALKSMIKTAQSNDAKITQLTEQVQQMQQKLASAENMRTVAWESRTSPNIKASELSASADLANLPVASGAIYNAIQPSSGAKPTAIAPITQTSKVAKIAQPTQTANANTSKIRSILEKAGLSIQGANSSTDGIIRWADKNVQGVATVGALNDNAAAMAKKFIDAQKAKCSGDFASMPSPSPSGSRTMTLYETACVGSSQGASTSFVFFEDQGQFVAISSQADADNMDAAMDSRDRIVTAVQAL